MAHAAAVAQVIPSGAMETLSKDRAAVPRNDERHTGGVPGMADDVRRNGRTAGGMGESLGRLRRHDGQGPVDRPAASRAGNQRRGGDEGRRHSAIDRGVRLAQVRHQPDPGLSGTHAVLRSRVAIDERALRRRLIEGRRRRGQPPRPADDDQGHQQAGRERGPRPLPRRQDIPTGHGTRPAMPLHRLMKTEDMPLLRRRSVRRQPRAVDREIEVAYPERSARHSFTYGNPALPRQGRALDGRIG